MRTEEVQRQVRALTPAELAAFRAWFLEYDADACEAQIAQDAQAGKHDHLAERALYDDAAGRTTPL